MAGSFRSQVAAAAEQAARQTGTHLKVSYSVRKPQPPHMRIRLDGLAETTRAAEFEVTCWWAKTVARDPDKGLDAFLQVFWLTLREICVLSDIDVFRGETGPDGPILYDGFTLIVRDPHIPTKVD